MQILFEGQLGAIICYNRSEATLLGSKDKAISNSGSSLS